MPNKHTDDMVESIKDMEMIDLEDFEPKRKKSTIADIQLRAEENSDFASLTAQDPALQGLVESVLAELMADHAKMAAYVNAVST